VVWGVSDRYSWLPELTGRRDAGTLFDLGYQPKSAFDGLVETLELSK
jgi:GH35 family endo-1,4-beta-xylanase